MTNDELQQKIESLLAVQANSETRIKRVEESFVLLVQMVKKADERSDTIDKRIDTVVKTHAETESSFNRKMESLLEMQADSETRIRRVEESFVLLVQMAKMTDERLDAIDKRLDNGDKRFDAMAESQARLSIKVEELAELQKNTDERLNTLIQVVERYISEGRNGKP